MTGDGVLSSVPWRLHWDSHISGVAIGSVDGQAADSAGPFISRERMVMADLQSSSLAPPGALLGSGAGADVRRDSYHFGT